MRSRATRRLFGCADSSDVDTVLVDYLVGAIEGFAAYWQDRVFERLRPLVAENGRLYIIGLEPYVHFEPKSPSGKIIWEIGRVRDACLLLADEQPYREHPLDWTLRQLGPAGFRMVESHHFPIRYRAQYIHSQVNMCQNLGHGYDYVNPAGQYLN